MTIPGMKRVRPNGPEDGELVNVWKRQRLTTNLVVFAAAVGLTLGAFLAAQTAFLVADALFYTLLWAAAGTAWAIHAGPAGRLSLGHAAYFGMGAYSAALLQTDGGASVWPALGIGFAVAALAAALIELVTGRLDGIYYALATFAFAQLMWLLARTWRSFTGGTNGIVIPFEPSGLINLIFEDPPVYVLIAGGAFVVALIAYNIALGSRLGYFVRALRDGAAAAKTMGLSGTRSRPVTAAISGGLTSVVGVVFAQNLLFVDPDGAIGFRITVLIITPAILGGLSYPFGALAGAAFMVPLRRWLLAGGLDVPVEVQLVLYGLVLMLVVLFVPQGLVGVSLGAWRRLRHGKRQHDV